MSRNKSDRLEPRNRARGWYLLRDWRRRNNLTWPQVEALTGLAFSTLNETGARRGTALETALRIEAATNGEIQAVDWLAPFQQIDVTIIRNVARGEPVVLPVDDTEAGTLMERYLKGIGDHSLLARSGPGRDWSGPNDPRLLAALGEGCHEIVVVAPESSAPRWRFQDGTERYMRRGSPAPALASQPIMAVVTGRLSRADLAGAAVLWQPGSGQKVTLTVVEPRGERWLHESIDREVVSDALGISVEDVERRLQPLRDHRDQMDRFLAQAKPVR